MKKYPRGQSRALPDGKPDRNQPSREVWSAFGGALPREHSVPAARFSALSLEGLGRQAFAVTVCDQDGRGVRWSAISESSARCRHMLPSEVHATVRQPTSRPRHGRAADHPPVARDLAFAVSIDCMPQFFFKASALERGDAPVIRLAIATSSDAFAYAGIRRWFVVRNFEPLLFAD
jgi:hypothetical protein